MPQQFQRYSRSQTTGTCPAALCTLGVSVAVTCRLRRLPFRQWVAYTTLVSGKVRRGVGNNADAPKSVWSGRGEGCSAAAPPDRVMAEDCEYLPQ